ncbi:MAG: hypothetical protein ABIF04_04295 [Chloroflexota bacterium]
MKKHLRIIVGILVTAMVIMACSFQAVSTPGPDLAGTQVALAQTQTALSNNPAQQPDDSNAQPTATFTQEQEPPPPPPPAALDIPALIDSANILVYEDIIADPAYIPYVKRALNSVGGHQVYVADAMGTFMDKMNSGTQWDLIIMASEMRSKISGEYWTALKDQVDNGVALVSETWYLDQISDGKIAPFLSECGVKVQRDWVRKASYNRIDYGMFWIDPSSPVFNTPNQVDRLSASLTNPAFSGAGTDIGDLMEVTDYSKAQILASLIQGNDTSYGVITSCMNGRVIMQTFDSHDYPTNEMVALWENYIIYTLTNHFQSMQ